ncbi:hypothetical protein CRG98_006648, partial [Punica granatum]
LTAITQLTHHGMIFVPIGYTFGAGMSEIQQPKGGTPYGAGTFAGDGQPKSRKVKFNISCQQKLIWTACRNASNRGVHGYRIYPEPIGIYPNG